MIYVVSDLHGSNKKFQKLLDEINFADRDIMYVLGDIVDYGEESIELLCDLSMRFNVIPIVGEHDFRAVRLLRALNDMLNDGVRPDSDINGEMAACMEDGGAKVMEDFKALDSELREGVLEYLEDSSLYEEVEVGSRKYLLVHAGIADYDPNTPLEDYMPEDFFSAPIDTERELIDGVTVIAGHVPTYMIEGADNGKIYYGEGSILIDCGAAFGEPLACLCLDNGKEYYIND
ncbi:MAG: metallophosphoesterase [Clostridia bacterium]|nr:metallophosphoesterase [Clostridia bacterium]